MALPTQEEIEQAIKEGVEELQEKRVAMDTMLKVQVRSGLVECIADSYMEMLTIFMKRGFTREEAFRIIELQGPIKVNVG